MELSGVAGSTLGHGSDFLPEFKAIHNRLKKRFLRKPNVSEASEQFSKLAKRMSSKNEPYYEGLCLIAVARCERSLGNIHGESEALIAAARCFLKAELSLKSIGCQSFEEAYQAAIQSYSDAIQTLEGEDSSGLFTATCLCSEVAAILYQLGKRTEAGNYYQRAADLCLRNFGSGLDYIHARERVADTLISSGDFQLALHVLTEVGEVTEQIGGKPVTSVYRDVLFRTEITRVLLLLLIDPTPQMMSPAETSILEKYSWESSLPNVMTSLTKQEDSRTFSSSGNLSQMNSKSPHYLPEEVFLLLQSLVMAVQLCDIDALFQLEDCLHSHLSSEPRQLELLTLLVKTSQEKP